MVTDTESTCVITLGKDEKCDDGVSNGLYGEKSSGKSHCKNDCSGRIKNGTEYFCGDGVVQYKDGESCSGVSCESVTTSNYPGATLSAFTASEQCDPSDTANNRTTLCNRALGLSRTSYYTPSTEPSCTASCSISNATKGTNCMWCGDGVWQTSQGEKCDSGKDYNNATGTTTLCNAKLGENRSSYYTPSTRPSCSTNCQTILNAVKGTNCQWCGDGVVNGSEACEPDVSTRDDEKGSVCDEGGWNESDTHWRYRYTCTSSCTWTYTTTCDW